MFNIHTKIVSFCLLLFVCFVCCCCCFLFLFLFFVFLLLLFVVCVFFGRGVIMKEYRCSLAALRVDLVVLNQTILNGFRY